MNRIVIFGAGAIGRGFVGALFGAANWRITFVDVSAGLVARLRADGGYRVVEVSQAGERSSWISGVTASLLGDQAKVVEAVAEADLVATAVGAANLAALAVPLARGLEARRCGGGGPLDALICENLHDAPQILARLVAAAVTQPAAAFCPARTAIGRMVPTPILGQSPTEIRVEPYGFLPYEIGSFSGGPPAVNGLVPIREHFDLFDDRKLYLHNLGHVMLAYLGELRGYQLISEAVGDVELRYLVRGAMSEAAAALADRHEVSAVPLLAHVDDLLARFGNAALGDTTQRVGRDPERKMQADDRLLGAYRLALRVGAAPAYLALAVALGQRRLAAEPGWDEMRVKEHLAQSLSSVESQQWRATRERLRDCLEAGFDFARLMGLIDGDRATHPVV